MAFKKSRRSRSGIYTYIMRVSPFDSGASIISIQQIQRGEVFPLVLSLPSSSSRATNEFQLNSVVVNK